MRLCFYKKNATVMKEKVPYFLKLRHIHRDKVQDIGYY